MELELPAADDRPLWEIWLSAHWLPCVGVADELGLFRALAADPATPMQLAERLGLGLRGVRAVVAMLASLGLLVQRGGTYGLGDMTRSYLLPESPFYWGATLSTARRGPVYGMIREALTRQADPGRPGRPVEAWESGKLGPEQARFIAGYMHGHHMAPAVAMARNGDFAGVERLLDVGGGSGCFSIALVRRLPGIRCTVMELPAMCAIVPDYVAAAGVDRVDTIAVDMFREAWPSGFDAMLFSNIFHDWEAETCAVLAGHAFAVLPSGGRIYLHEMLLDDTGDGPRTAVAFSVLMLGTLGRQYGLPELAAILEGAGFGGIRATATHGEYSLVSARKP